MKAQHAGMLILLVGILALPIGAAHTILFPFVFHDTDEAAYMYVGEGWTQGEIPYRDAYQTKPPGIYAIYALGSFLTPHSMMGVRVFSYLAMSAALLLTLAWTRRKKWGWTWTFVVGGLLFLNPSIQADAAITEIFCLPFLIYWVTRGVSKNNDAASATHSDFFLGLAGGCAIVLSVFSIPFILAILALRFMRKTLTRELVVGAVVLPLSALAYFLYHNALPGMMYSLIAWPAQYQAVYFFSEDGLRNLMQVMIVTAPAWIGIILFWFLSLQKKFEDPETIGIILGWTFLIGAPLIMLGSFFPHHFVLFWFPFVIGTAGALHCIQLRFGTAHSKAVGIFLVALLAFSAFGIPRPVHADGGEDVGRWIAEHTGEGDPIYIWGYVPQFYFFSQRRAPTPFFDSFSVHFIDKYPPLPDVREKLLEDFARNPPKIMMVHPRYANPSLIDPYLEGYTPHPEFPAMYVRNE